MSSIKSWISAFTRSSVSLSQTTHKAEDEAQLPDFGGLNVNLQPSKASTNQPTYDGRISSFVFLVSSLERKLDDTPVLIDQFGSTFTQREPIASGASFTVERAVWVSTPTNKDSVDSITQRWGKYVALKYVHVHRPGERDESIRWKHILLEIRALLHEPIRYHPNIVRLLGSSWGAARGSRSNFPLLLLEFSELGTLADLQTNEEPMLFQTKKKLCFDISKGISILHACGIVHGDLKHENVLIFANRDNNSDIAYTAKLADFGGSVMDLDVEGSSLHMGTPPYDAPESREGGLTAEGMKKTDVYSLGLLIWRTFLNGENPFAWLAKEMNLDNEEELMELKRSGSETLLQFAKETVRKYEGTPEELQSTIEYALEYSLQENPEQRQLNRTVAGLQATTYSDILILLKVADDANTKDDSELAMLPPGHHGILPDRIGLYLAKNGRNNGYYDYQKTGPGYRPFISSPDPTEFLFEPEKLKFILDWDTQVAIIQDLEKAATASPGQLTTQISNATASFYLFKSHCHEFGVAEFNAEQACYWLRQTASTDEDCQESYLAKAWCWRVHRALDVTLEVDMSTLREWMTHSIVRGHVKCIAEAESIAETISDRAERWKWEGDIDSHTTFLRVAAAGIGSPYFMSLEWPLSNFNVLDRSIREEFERKGINKIDEIYVNDKGHGLLHYAAATGNVKALRYLVETYSPNIDISNQHASETPLLCACRSGHLDCALYLLDQGASPDGTRDGRETPLYWLCAFTEKDIPQIAARLVKSGSSLTNNAQNRGTRSPNFRLWVDYEDFSCLPVSPLSRAVIMENLPAVRALLTLGADPLEQLDARSSVCPVVLAAVLMLPDILEVLLAHVDANSETPVQIFDELEMLRMAMDRQATMQDPTAMLNRITRCSANANVALDRTLRILHEREVRLKSPEEEERLPESPSSINNVMSRLVLLGRRDIVRSLLELGYHYTVRTTEGVPSPILEAVKKNDEFIFRLLDDFNVEVPMEIVGPIPNLLYLLAERPTYSRPGLYIANYLLDILGLPVELELDPSSPSSARIIPFAAAVKNGYFDLANLLLERGADMDRSYKRGLGQASLLTDLIYTGITERDVDSIRWLLNLDEEGRSLRASNEKSRCKADLLPKFVPGNIEALEWSVLHLVASRIPKTAVQKRAVSRMTRMLLCVDSYREKIDYTVPGVGTTLFCASLFNNLEVVSELVERGASLSMKGDRPNTPKEGVELVLSTYPNLVDAFKQKLGVQDNRAAEELVWRRYMLIWETLNSRS